ncbi:MULTISPECIES: Co2+/Mg2+ efflux protein ApaG [Neisseria]|uniref:Co2+/Mg2+ efflux protein ApaG n=1 Tax=Neisseria TaxID=482 RepID=UPI0006CE93F7|nr:MULTISPECIES: Co2+/Mg2+ efflux protein ApaG [Neisseria]KPN72505.1 hypothetical protein AKG09_01245 [Neisseria sp. 83E34]
MENSIEVIVEPRYLADQSNLIKDRYIFAYHIKIRNHGGETVTLKNRFWEITDAHGEVEKVSGAGVVGEQPTLYPGDDFEYSSGTHLSTPWGSMKGYYEFEDDMGGRFMVQIPEFDLKANIMLQ